MKDQASGLVIDKLRTGEPADEGTPDYRGVAAAFMPALVDPTTKPTQMETNHASPN